MSGPEGGAVREATLEAVHSDQLRMQEQLKELSDMLTRLEQHLMGGPQVQMLGAAAAQEAALGTLPTDRGPISAALPGKLPQMCELGTANSQVVSDMYGRLTHLTGLLGVPQ